MGSQGDKGGQLGFAERRRRAGGKQCIGARLFFPAYCYIWGYVRLVVRVHTEVAPRSIILRAASTDYLLCKEIDRFERR